MPRWPWIFGGLTLLALSSRRTAPTGGNDLDALASMLIAETGFRRSKDEMAQIVWVALNRARRTGDRVSEIVDPRRTAPPIWNSGPIYRERFDSARIYRAWVDARDFAKDVMAGRYPNLGAVSFVHPGGMPTPPCQSNRVPTPTAQGVRCLPPWIVGGRVVGGAMFA